MEKNWCFGCICGVLRVESHAVFIVDFVIYLNAWVTSKYARHGASISALFQPDWKKNFPI